MILTRFEDGQDVVVGTFTDVAEANEAAIALTGKHPFGWRWWKGNLVWERYTLKQDKPANSDIEFDDCEGCGQCDCVCDLLHID